MTLRGPLRFAHVIRSIVRFAKYSHPPTTGSETPVSFLHAGPWPMNVLFKKSGQDIHVTFRPPGANRRELS